MEGTQSIYEIVQQNALVQSNTCNFSAPLPHSLSSRLLSLSVAHLKSASHNIFNAMTFSLPVATSTIIEIEMETARKKGKGKGMKEEKGEVKREREREGSKEQVEIEINMEIENRNSNENENENRTNCLLQ